MIPSNLFKECLDFLGSRKEAKEWYAISINERFRELAANSLKYDDNNEVTFQSLRETMSRYDPSVKEKEDSFLSILTDITANKRTGETVKDRRQVADDKGSIRKLLYDEYGDEKEHITELWNALDTVRDFNEKSGYRKKYIAVIERVKDYKKNGMYVNRPMYRFKIVKRTKAVESALAKTIYDAVLYDKIMHRLIELGVSVRFLEQSEDTYEGMYSTEDADKTADGLYALIQLASFSEDSRGRIPESALKALAEEAGHFAIGALGDSLIVKRLMDLLSDEKVQKAAFGDDYQFKMSGTDSLREAAGYLVGQMIQTEPKYYEGPLKFISILCHRIWLEAKRIFAKIRGDAVEIDRREAEKIAREIALGFMSDNFEGSVENAVKQRETLFSSIGTANIRAFRIICNSVQLMVDNLRVVLSSEDFRENDIVAAAMKALEQRNQLDSLEVRNGTVFGNTMAIGGIVSMLVQLMPLAEQFGVVERYIDEIEYYMVYEQKFTKVVKEVTDKLRTVRVIADQFAVITSNLNKMLDPKSVTRITGAENGVRIVDRDGNDSTVDLMTLMFGEKENGKRKNDRLLRMTQDLKTT